MGAKRTVAARIGQLRVDEAFSEAEARSLAGEACEIWCRRDSLGRPVAYRVVPSLPESGARKLPVGAPKPGARGQQWERIAFFLAIGGPSKAPRGHSFPMSA